MSPEPCLEMVLWTEQRKLAKHRFWGLTLVMTLQSSAVGLTGPEPQSLSRQCLQELEETGNHVVQWGQSTLVIWKESCSTRLREYILETQRLFVLQVQTTFPDMLLGKPLTSFEVPVLHVCYEHHVP